MFSVDEEDRQAPEVCAVPSGKRIGEVLPVFKGIRCDIRIGEPNHHCACCTREFTVAIKPRRVIRLYQTDISIPVRIEARICGRCAKLFTSSSKGETAVIDAVRRFVFGGE